MLKSRLIEIGRRWLDRYFEQLDSLRHHGIKGQKWGVRNGPPYPIKDREEVVIAIKHDKIKAIKISKEKFTEYALDPKKAPDKATAFKLALGYTKDNADELIDSIILNFDADKLEERGDNGYGMRYQQIIKMKGLNGKEAHVLTAWIDDENSTIKLTSVYVTKKESSK